MISAYINKLDTKTLNKIEVCLGILTNALSSLLVYFLCLTANVDAFVNYVIAFQFIVFAFYFILKRNQLKVPGSASFITASSLGHVYTIFILFFLLNSLNINIVFISITLASMFIISILRMRYANPIFKDVVKNSIELNKIDDLAKEGKLHESFVLALDAETSRVKSLRKFVFLFLIPTLLWYFVVIGTYVKVVLFFEPGVLITMSIVFLLVFSSALLNIMEEVNKILIKKKLLYERGE